MRSKCLAAMIGLLIGVTVGGVMVRIGTLDKAVKTLEHRCKDLEITVFTGGNQPCDSGNKGYGIFTLTPIDIVCLGAIALLLLGIGCIAGADWVDARRAKKDKADADKLRAAIREQDDDAPRPVQSASPVARPQCARGPEICDCAVCHPPSRPMPRTARRAF